MEDTVLISLTIVEKRGFEMMFLASPKASEGLLWVSEIAYSLPGPQNARGGSRYRGCHLQVSVLPGADPPPRNTTVELIWQAF